MNLVERLKAHGCKYPIGDEAADELTRLQAENSSLSFALADVEALELGTAERCEKLQAENKRLEAEVNRINASPTIEACRQMISDKAVVEASDLHNKLAACQLENSKLREWVKASPHRIFCMRLDIYDERDHGCTCGKETISTPTDTEALEKYVSERIERSELAEVSAIQIANLTSRLETLLVKYAALKERNSDVPST